jgi:UDP-N-acetyl-D-mannosaminuronate dehydrogenase
MPDPLQKSCVSKQAIALAKRIEARSSCVGIIGMGYVGLPLAVATFSGGYPVLGFDVDPQKISALNNGESPIGRIDNKTVAGMRESGRFEVTNDYARLAGCDVIILCVPTPLNKYREPDLSYVTGTTRSIAPYLRQGQLIALESTTYPGTTREIMRPILETGGLKSGEDFFLAFSPEREDPGNPDYHTATIPKVVGGDGPDASLLASQFYGSVVKRVVEVSSCEVARLRDVRIHDLRHSFGSVGVSGGASLPIIGKLLGHAKSSTTEKYSHLAADPVHAVNEAMGNQTAAMLSGQKGEIVKLPVVMGS